ncbi:nonribosomal peptide synthase GliP-like, putative [Talaromyces stipitatus ATCC 10500]|uniref:Nonribosomal peptide synthase GliP-like, putative n=1 Tax=Talaromyces stipitatus (strain ATCC 10500 / CBS 375.48 / QM 6759 / NRRL 1006) TaxID=441959 RepID=B8MQ38_TALSN|nr:nonribosomal peptide synthase GliP-like, putative [Talaromyces stipitatus ATCC 10500]EED13064.1 nonribosomal peptide synthase GliP-like, putative [Talaromyces stipitatus ATCC 10500]
MMSIAPNGTARQCKTVCDKIEQWAVLQPDHIAISFGDRKVSYSELDNSASHIAWLLSQRNIGKGDRVPVLAQRSPEMVACFLGVLKSGALYVPIDTESWSRDRIQWTLKKVSARVILNTTTDHFPEYEEISHDMIDSAFSPTEELTARRKADQKFHRPWERIQPDDLAYIIFTSGTTSTPKGVMIPHSCVLNYVEQGGPETPFNLNATPEDRVMLIFSPGFDACTGVIVSTLCNGAELQIATTSDFLYTVTLCTTMVCTPSVLNTIQDPKTCSKLRTIVLGGEAPPISLVRRWATTLPTCTLYNFYGPTETTFASLVARLHPDKPIVLGRPMSNSRVFLLDGEREANYGEICLAGPGLGKGYFQNESLTNEKFVHWRGERIYRTGDFARKTEHGLEFAGRKDSFVKNRGFLVNLESQVIPILYDDPVIIAATAFMHRGRLVAFVTPDGIDTASLRERLASQHDSFVVPDMIRALEFLPLTANGKANNRALEQLLDSETSETNHTDTTEFIQKDASVIDILKGAISHSLHLPISNIDESHSFREMGGNSLAGLKVLSFLQTKGLKLRLIHLFDLPSLSSVCEVIEHSTDSQIAPANLDPNTIAHLTTGPMTSIQTKMVQAGLKNPTVNYILLRITFPHPGTTLNAQKLKDSWYRVMQRHSIFRTTFVLKEGLQIVNPSLNITWDSEETSEEQRERLIEFRSRELRERISWLRQNETFTPVQACNFITVPAKSSTLLVLVHHIQADGWSFSIILDELRSALDDNDLEDPPRYMHVAIAQKRLEDDVQGKAFWSQMLENLPDQPNITLLPPSINNKDTYWSSSIKLELDMKPEELETAARLRNVTAATLVYCAWGLVLSNYLSMDNVSFGVVFSGRNIVIPGVDKVVGPLLNTCPFVLDLGHDETIDGLLSQAQNRLLHMMEYQWSADEALTKIPASRIANIFQTVVVVEYDLPTVDQPCSTLPIPWVIEREDKMEFDISLLLEREKDDLRARILFDGSQFAESSIRGILSHFRNALQKLLQSHNSSVQSVREGIITGKERNYLLTAANQTVEYTGYPTLKDAFEAAATQWPDLMAVESTSGSITYQQLNIAADSLANHIRSLIDPKTVVGILTDGSLYWIVSILAVLKAGCICCPIDINLPKTRIDTIISQSGARLFVASNRRCTTVVPNGHDNVVICEEFLGVSERSNSQLPTVSRARDVVYLVFTSGSTGTPKGVALHNQSILMAIDSEPVRLFTTPGRRNAQVYSLGFDVVTVEIFGTLCYGGTLVLKDPNDPLGHLKSVHAAYSTPSLLASFSPDDFFGLDTINLAGEPVPQSIADTWSYKRLSNGYGPSECGPISTFARLLPGKKVTIGKAVPHLNVYLLDHRQCLVALGVIGEIYLSGPQVTDGYWNLPDQTKKCFLPNPFSPGQLMYKTGDLGLWTEDMSLAYMGRIDNQVKVRGFRIELEEIDRALVLANPSIQRAAAIVADHIRIVAFVTPSNIDTLAVIARLRDLLPAYTRPSQIIALDTLPQSANLKIDRKALQALASEFKDQGDPPSTSTECLVAEVWHSVLGRQEGRRINKHDDFLGIGGNSLLAIKAARLISESIGYRIPVPLILRETVLSSLAKAIDNYSHVEESENNNAQSFKSYIANLKTPVDLASLHPLSELEEELYVWHMISENKSLLNTAFRFELDGVIDIEILRHSLVSVIRQNPILRARYLSQGDGVVRRISGAISAPLMFVGNALDIHKLQSLVNQPFDLSQDQLIRVIIWERTGVSTSLILVVHHIVIDKHSLSVLLKSISDQYGAKLGLIREKQTERHLPKITYLDWVQWRQQRPCTVSLNQKKLDFWKEKMDKLTTISTLRQGCILGLELGSYESLLIPYTGVTHVSQRIVLAATALTLQAVYGHSDVTLGIPYANRDEPGASDLIGLFLDRLPIRLSLKSANISTSDKLLQHVIDEINMAVEHQLPYSQILAAAGKNGKPLFDVMVIYHWRSDALDMSLNLPGVKVSSTPIRARGAKFPLQLEFTETDEGLHCGLEYNSRVTSPSQILTIMSFLSTAIHGLACQRTIADILSEFEIHKYDTRQTISLAYKNKIDKVREAFSATLTMPIDDIKPDTSFFDVGGTSMTAFRLHHRLEELGLHGYLRDILHGPTPEKIAWMFYDNLGSI